MADEQHSQLELILQILEQVEDLCLDRDIQRRRGFIADQQARPGGQGAGDRDALALATGKLVRILETRQAAQPDVIQQIADDLFNLPFVFRQLMEADRLGDDVGYLHARIHGGVGILEHHLHLATQRAALVLTLEGRQVDPLEDDLALVRRIEAGDHPSDGGLA